MDPPPDRLICKICHLSCREAQQSECCGSVYCKCDIDRLKANSSVQPTCPFCRSEEFVTYPNLSIDREIQQLTVYCPYKDTTGCNWTGKLKDVDKHHSYGKECETECDKCKTIVKHKLLGSHLDTECPCYCPYCDITAEKEVISSNHKEKCSKFPITCPNNCGLDDIPRDHMDDHKKVCPLEMIQCEFHDVGCEVTFPRKDEETHATDDVTTHLQLARRRLTVLNKMLEDSNARYLESTEKFTGLLSDLQERMKKYENPYETLSKDLTKTHKEPTVDVEVQTDVDANHIEMASNILSKIINTCAMSRNCIILMFITLVLSFAVSVTFTISNYYKTADDYDLQTVQEFHGKVSVVLYELIDQSTLSWPDKLYYWSNITSVAPVVLKFSEFSLQKNSILQSRTFFAFTNGYLMCLRIYPSGYSGVTTKGQYVSVFLVFMKGPNDDALERLGYFPTNKLFTIELLDPTGDFHLQVEVSCDIYRVHDVTGKENVCGRPQFVSLNGFSFKKPKCQCNKINPTICCYLTDDDALYFRVQETKQKPLL